MKHESRPGPVEKASEILKTGGARELARRVAARLKSFAFKSNSAVWFGKALTPEDITVRVETPSGGKAAGSVAAAAGFGTASPRPVDGAAGSFAVADPRELAEWLRGAAGLAWAADERELDVATKFGHRWTRWTVDGRNEAFCKVGGGRVFIVDFDMAFDLPDGIAYLSDVYVMSRMRRTGIGRALLAQTMQFLRNQSFDGVVCHIHPTNSASLSLFGSLGFVPLGQVSFTRVLGIPAFSRRPEKILREMSSMCAPRGRLRTGRAAAGSADPGTEL